MRTFLIGIFLFLANPYSLSAEIEDIGPAIGSKIPHNLSVKDDQGNEQSFNTVVGQKGAVLIFYRSANWCPFCKNQLIDLNKSAAKPAKALGYNLIGISYDAVPALNKFKVKYQISYPLLSDEGSKIIEAFGIRNEEHKEGHFAYGIPHPMIIVTDEHGIVKAKLREEGYRNRPEVEVLLETLKSL
ncbi:peroxiredoxin family protein [Kordiimonas sp. SCSIO 12610]|uniref:peroxiredoxin family protein n=1 Tax=Kordiimonas sp. SCSIO 12610 TaxID=2829597 RepID=UPI00210DC151|nr:peroxiredoxin family protein [Kordiimonas sp. SCSIO 12610]UTW54981.1 peroxiredoxin family protein [Kordiimonas sp. SCSIO 12610]